MVVRHLHRVNELLTALEQPTPEMRPLRSPLTDVRGRYPQPPHVAGVDTLSDLPHGGKRADRPVPLWHDIKHHQMQARGYAGVSHLKQAVDQALNNKAGQLMARTSESMDLQRMAA